MRTVLSISRLLRRPVTSFSPSVRAQVASANLRIFRVAAREFPWKTQSLLNARIESNDQADGDALVIYHKTVFGDPSWASLGRVTGWYKDALMRKGRMNPAVGILVSEYQSVSDAQRALLSEKRAPSYRDARSHPHLGSESVEFAGSPVTSFIGGEARVEDANVYTRVKNLEIDVAVFDVHVGTQISAGPVPMPTPTETPAASAVTSL